MRIEERISGGVRILRLAGDLDAPDVAQVAREIDATSPAGAVRLVLNLEGVRFASAAVLGHLAEARAKARKRAGDLVLSAPPKSLVRVLRVLGLDQVLRAYRTDDDAIRHLRAGVVRSGASRPGTLRPHVGGCGAAC